MHRKDGDISSLHGATAMSAFARIGERDRIVVNSWNTRHSETAGIRLHAPLQSLEEMCVGPFALVAVGSVPGARHGPRRLSGDRPRLDHLLDFSLPGLPGGAEVVFELET